MARHDFHRATTFAFSISPWTVYYHVPRYSCSTSAWIALVGMPLFALILADLTAAIAGFALVLGLHSRTWLREDLAAAVLQVKCQEYCVLTKNL